MKDNATDSFDEAALLTFEFLLFVGQKHEAYTAEMFTAMDTYDSVGSSNPDSFVTYFEYMAFLTIQNIFLKAIYETGTSDVETLALTDTLTDFTPADLVFYDINSDGTITY